VKTYNPVHFDMGSDSLFIPAIPERPTTVGSGLDCRDRPAVLTTECDRGNSARCIWNEARREIIIHLYCNWPDKKEIDAAVDRMREQHVEITGVVIYVDPTIYQDSGPLFHLWGFERDIRREQNRIPYLALVRATGEKLPDRPTPEESVEEKALREAKELVRSS
jgi:hypothetical protein